MTYVFLASIRPKGRELLEFLQQQCAEHARVVFDDKPGGYWRALNRMLRTYNPKRFVWLSDDCEPKDGWINILIERWENEFKDDLGLLVCNDKFLKHGGAAFAMTSPTWLYVLFGRRRFPGRIKHYFLDSLIADRSKELERYVFCEEAVVEHRHWQAGKASDDNVYQKNRRTSVADKTVKDEMDSEWQTGGVQAAKKRYEKVRRSWNT